MYHRRQHPLKSSSKTSEDTKGRSWTPDQAEASGIHFPPVDIEHFIAKQLEEAEFPIPQSSPKTLQEADVGSCILDQFDTSTNNEYPFDKQSDEIPSEQSFTLVTSKKSKRTLAKPDIPGKKSSMEHNTDNSVSTCFSRNRTKSMAPKKPVKHHHVVDNLDSFAQHARMSDISSDIDRHDWDAAEFHSLSPKINGNRIVNNDANLENSIYYGDDWDAAEALSMSPKISVDSRRRTHINTTKSRSDKGRNPAIYGASDDHQPKKAKSTIDTNDLHNPRHMSHANNPKLRTGKYRITSKKRRQEEERPSPTPSPAYPEEEIDNYHKKFQYQIRRIPLEVADLARDFKPLHPILTPFDVLDCVKAHGSQIVENISRHLPFLDRKEVVDLLEDIAAKFAINPLSIPEDNISVTVYYNIRVFFQKCEYCKRHEVDHSTQLPPF